MNLNKETSEMAVRAVLTKFSDGAWHNIAPSALDCTASKAVLIALKVGMAIRRGWMEEKDYTWVRLTPAGQKEVRAMYGEDSEARAYRLKAEELRTVADNMESQRSKANFRRLADNYDRLAQAREDTLENDLQVLKL